MRAFRRELDRRRAPRRDRRWLFVPYDQLSDRLGPLSREEPRDLGIVVVENPAKAARRPYHRQKLALVLANLRHFALEQAARGVAVRHVVHGGSYADALRSVLSETGPLRVMEPAERELRVELAPLVESGALELLPHEGWLTTGDQFLESSPQGPPWRMDAFYRRVRRDTGILMEGDKPIGGKYSFDAENRRPWKGTPPAPSPPRFDPDPVTEEVGAMIESRFSRHPGVLDLTRLPATADDAEALWRWAREACLPHFGPYEDAMSTRSSGLFHTRVSALVNLHRLLPARVIGDALALDLPHAGLEGFVRQVLGWREFVRHVHRATDGFRDLPGERVAEAEAPGDGGYARWSGSPWERPEQGDGDGGARPSHLRSRASLPPLYWGRPSGMHCVDRVVSEVWEEGYTHHIPRLMVLANLATLLDVEPREITDWFWAAYTDAYDWVVEPNVLGMGTFAAGDVMTTKPYVCGGAYIHRMGDYCGDCRFDPRSDCPITALYWAFLARKEDRLRANPRVAPVLRGLSRRDAARRERDARIFEGVRRRLREGHEIRTGDTEP